MKDFSENGFSLGIVGAGIMGRGIAQVAAAAGADVLICDTDPGALRDAVSFVGRMLDRGVEKGRMTTQEAEACKAHIRTSDRLSNLAGAHLVVEAIVERLENKRTLFRELETIVGEDCVLATNTSSLSVTEIAAACRRPERIAGLHFFNPAPLMKLVEVVRGECTDAAIPGQLANLVTRLGHTPVQVQDSPGFLVNHLGRGMVTEGLRLLQEGVAEPATIDRIMRECAGFPMGPFELMDLTGLDVTWPASEQIYNRYFQEPRLRPTPEQQRRHAAGLLGRKSARGFYVYRDGRKVEPAEPPVPGVRNAASLWVDPSVPDLVKPLKSALRKAGVKLDAGRKPGANSIIVVTPLGLDVSSAQVAADAASRTVGVDTLFGIERRLTLMGSPAVDPEVINTAWAALAKTGAAVSVVRDSAGFVAQRMVAAIINIACEIAQQGVARPGDIDVAARLALGYPQGPLAWGDRIGAGRVLEVLSGLHACYADPRYRPSPWLRRRARLGLSLLAEEPAGWRAG